MRSIAAKATIASDCVATASKLLLAPGTVGPATRPTSSISSTTSLAHFLPLSAFSCCLTAVPCAPAWILNAACDSMCCLVSCIIALVSLPSMPAWIRIAAVCLCAASWACSSARSSTGCSNDTDPRLIIIGIGSVFCLSFCVLLSTAASSAVRFAVSAWTLTAAYRFSVVADSSAVVADSSAACAAAALATCAAAAVTTFSAATAFFAAFSLAVSISEICLCACLSTSSRDASGTVILILRACVSSSSQAWPASWAAWEAL